MKIALPSSENRIDDHFGHCAEFVVYTVDDSKQITGEVKVPSPNGCGCKSNIANVLSGMGVTLLLAGNMGEGAVNVLYANGINVVRGCSGDTKKAVLAWLDGKIEDNSKICQEHQHGCAH
jgi:predicted Fe-Mo cluster-binding NifX family protein